MNVCFSPSWGNFSNYFSWKKKKCIYLRYLLELSWEDHSDRAVQTCTIVVPFPRKGSHPWERNHLFPILNVVNLRKCQEPPVWILNCHLWGCSEVVFIYNVCFWTVLKVVCCRIDNGCRECKEEKNDNSDLQTIYMKKYHNVVMLELYLLVLNI